MTELPGGIVYVVIGALAKDQVDLPALHDAMAKHRGASGWIIDLRFNGGGDERMGQALAGMFTDQPMAYARRQTIDGEGDLGPVVESMLEPVEPALPKWPIVVLQGRRTMSSAEAFVLMWKAVGATTIGEHTRGSSGNPQPHDLGRGITLYLPSWVAMDAAGEGFEGTGLAPDWVVPFKPAPSSPDPVLDAAVARLIEPTAPAESE